MKPALYILLLFGFLQASSQQLKFSGEYKVSGRVEKAQILGKTSAGYIIRKIGDQEVLELYSSNLNFIKSKTVVVGNQQVIRAEIVGDNIIFYCLNMDERKAYLNAVVVNSDLTHSSIRKEIDSFDLNEDEKSKNFKVTSSQGALLTAIVHVKEQDEDLKSIRVDVLNLNAEVEYRREINIVSEAAYRKVLRKTMLDNEGNAYLIVEKEPRSLSKSDDARAFTAYKVSKGNETIGRDFYIDKEIFDNPKIIFDYTNKKIVFTCFIDESGSGEKGSTGVYLMKIGATDLSVEQKASSKFSKSFISKLTGKDTLFVQEKLLTFKIKDVLLDVAGNPIVIAESFFQTTESVPVTNNFFSNNTYPEYRNINVYNYNDLLLFWMNESGQIGNSTILRKKQVTEDDGGIYSSYITNNNGDKLNFIHTDMMNGNIDLVLQAVDETGHIDKKILIADLERSNPVIAKMGKQVSMSELVLPCFRNSSFKLLKITFF
ncbi:MAG: hypothetical protein KA797_00915 [Chitinophagales bacterium]|nr:hypothetical protein [Chitinophagales bacterium]